jgi:hypothetical protein
MEKVICIDVSTYRNALTRGKEYEVLERNDDKETKVKDDLEDISWYPSYCFTSNYEDFSQIRSITIDDKIQNAYLDAIEVTLVISQGTKETKRWCYFLTPAYVYKTFNDPRELTFTTGQHGIFIPVLTEETIKNAIYHLESQNQLLEHTLPLGELEDADDIDDQ